MSSLLTTMAILLADYDERKDYLSNFEPFVLDRLKAWPEDEGVRPKRLVEALSAAFSLPAIPINTASLLRDRVKRDGFLRHGHDGKDYPNRSALKDVPEIASERREVLTHFDALGDAVRSYASSKFDLNWSESDVDGALSLFAEKFGVEMAMAKHEGSLTGIPDSNDEAMIVVHSFARRAIETESEHVHNLEELVKGSMLANVIYFQDLGNWTPSLEQLVVYLDTPFALRLLEVEPDEVAAAAFELMKLIAEFDVPVRVFEHTLEEILGVLEAIKHSLTRARRDEFDPKTVSAMHKESIEHLLRKGWGAGDVQQVISDLDSRLNDLGVIIEPTPAYSRELGLDERRFEGLLGEYGYRHEHQIVKDVRSLSAIHRLRNGRVCRDLSKTPAVFLTSNDRLVRASARFFSETGHGCPVAHCMSDISLTTQIWLRRPGRQPEVAQKILMAESFAALQPSAALWSRYLEKIALQKVKGGIDDRQVKVLVLSSASREGLVEITRGDPSRVADKTPLEVLDRYRDIVSRHARSKADRASRAEEQVAEENRLLQKDIERLRQQATERDGHLATQDRQLQFQERKIRELESWKTDQAERAAERTVLINRVRSAAGVSGATVLLGAAVGLTLLNTVEKPMILSIVWVLASVAALAVLSWGLRRKRGWTWKAVVVVGVLAGIFGAVYGIFSQDSSTSAASQERTSAGRKD